MAVSIKRRVDFSAPDYPHGRSGYAYGCHCQVCRDAMAEYRRERRRAGKDPMWSSQYDVRRRRHKPGTIMHRSPLTAHLSQPHQQKGPENAE
jgi:hypothetical protein